MKKYIEENKEYVSNLFDNEIGRDARKYLQNRGIKPSTAKIWELGFSPKGFIPQCYKNDKLKSNFYEKMNGRITIPVYNANGELACISGRAIYEGMKPKYMHYPFPTHKSLFGLWMNKEQIFNDDLIVFCEGQFDVINAWQYGFRNCVCTFGAHFGNEQIIYASRYTKRIAIMYDGDEAGQEGAKKSLQKITNRGDMSIRNYSFLLKNGQDVDDWVKSHNYHDIFNYYNNTQIDFLKRKLSRIIK